MQMCVHYCTTALLHYSTTALLHYSIPPFLHYSTTPLLHYCTTALLHYSTTALLHYCTTALHVCTCATASGLPACTRTSLAAQWRPRQQWLWPGRHSLSLSHSPLVRNTAVAVAVTGGWGMVPWVSEWVRQWCSDAVSECNKMWTTNKLTLHKMWINEGMKSEWVSECIVCLISLISEWVSEWVSESSSCLQLNLHFFEPSVKTVNRREPPPAFWLHEPPPLPNKAWKLNDPSTVTNGVKVWSTVTLLFTVTIQNDHYVNVIY